MSPNMITLVLSKESLKNWTSLVIVNRPRIGYETVGNTKLGADYIELFNLG